MSSTSSIVDMYNLKKKWKAEEREEKNLKKLQTKLRALENKLRETGGSVVLDNEMEEVK